MLVCKYTKTDTAAFIPHLDILRHVDMTLRRASISVEKSQGFNPHSKIFFGPPLSLGINSIAEYFVVFTDCLPQDFIERFNRHSINGLVILKVWQVSSDPNIYAKICYASYLLEFEQSRSLNTSDVVERIAKKESWLFDYDKNGVQKTQDIRPLIRNIKSKDNIIECILSCGNVSLRATRLCKAIEDSYGIKTINIIKCLQFDKNMADIDSCINAIAVAECVK